MKRYFSVSLIFLALFAAGCAHLGMGSRTDQQIASDVQNKINADTNFPDKQLNVSAANGVVTLSGNVSSDAARSAAANDAAQVEGVRTVVNNLRVAAPVTAASSEPPSQPQKQTSYNPPAAYSSPAKAGRPSPRTGTPRASNTSAKAADPQNNNSSDSDARTTAPYTGTVNSARQFRPGDTGCTAGATDDYRSCGNAAQHPHQRGIKLGEGAGGRCFPRFYLHAGDGGRNHGDPHLGRC